MHFRSKDDLIAAYLETRDEPTLARYETWLDTTRGTMADQVMGFFNRLARFAADGKWKGCGFLRAAAELAGRPRSPGIENRIVPQEEVRGVAGRSYQSGGLDAAALRARQLMVLLDGAVAQMLTHRDPSYARVAGQLTAALPTKDDPVIAITPQFLRR